MSDIVQQLANYQSHFDRAISRSAPSASHVIEPDEEGGTVVVDLTASRKGTHQANGARRLWQLAVSAAAAAVVIVGVVALVNRGDETVVTEPATSSDGTAAAGSVEDSATATITGYFAAFNARDIDAMMRYFDEDSVIVGHPLVGSDPVEGIDRIEPLLRTSISMSADTDAFLIENVAASGTTVTWDDQWTNSQGQIYCGVGNSAVVEDGIIATWTVASDAPCP